jgi:1,6-anhydro-N-acetylmuramate kinase
MTCPAVAVEIAPKGPANRAAGAPPIADLDDADYQAKIAEALAAALLEWRTEAREP